MVDINRGTTGVQLPPEVSQEIWQNVPAIVRQAILRKWCARGR